MKKIIPITILTGFLGAGKTTLVNNIIQQNPDKKFGLIINEFGEQGIDGSIVESNSEEEIVEISNGCLCCVSRGDLIKSAKKLIDSSDIDYIIIETSGLAEPMPVAQTFAVDNIDGRVMLDSVVCVIDSVNHNNTKETYRIAIEQIYSADIIILNKAQEATKKELIELKENILKVNQYAYFIENHGDIDTKLLLETGKWSFEKIVENQIDKQTEHCDCGDNCASKNHSDDHCKCDQKDHSCEGKCNHDHVHEHSEVDEFVYSTSKIINLEKFEDFIINKFPKEIVRSKGFIKSDHTKFPVFLFQMVGAKKMMTPFKPTKKILESNSRIVFIGKNLNKNLISKLMDNTLI